MTRPSLAEQLIARLRELGHQVDDTYVLERTRAGRQQVNAGAWSWRLRAPGYSGIIYGSQWPASRIVRCKNWGSVGPEFYGEQSEHSIDPCRGCGG